MVLISVYTIWIKQIFERSKHATYFVFPFKLTISTLEE